jgi:hypothetical protein
MMINIMGDLKDKQINLLLWFVEGVAERDCDYNDNCPPFSGSRHYQCDYCKARETLKKFEELKEQQT